MLVFDEEIIGETINITQIDIRQEQTRELEEINRKLAEKEAFENSLPEQLDDITSALCELADIGAESEVSIEDLMDAVTELAELVAQVIGD